MNEDSLIIPSAKLTEDGSNTLFSPYFQQYYRSTFGAFQESQRIFIDLGLLYCLENLKTDIHVFELGFGTGLNALLTSCIAEKYHQKVNYTAIEVFPISLLNAKNLKYDELGYVDFMSLHEANWQTQIAINQYFILEKIKKRFEDFETNQLFDLVYFDAFSPETQPELWTTEAFEKIASMMKVGGVLTTYCSKVYVQRNLREAGFIVEKHQGPAHKRDVIRAIFQNL